MNTHEDTWLQRGRELSSSGQHENALACFDRAIADRASVAALCGKGDALFALGRYRDSLAQFEAAIALDGRAPYPFYGKGRALTKLGSHVEAIAPLRSFLELSRAGSKLAGQVSAWLLAVTRASDIPSVPPPSDVVDLARALRASGKPREALTALEPIAATPRADVWMERARCHEDLGRPQLAEEAVIEALMRNDRDPDAWALRARIEAVLNKRAETRRALETVLRLRPTTPAFLVVVASIYAKLGDHALAVRYAMQTLEREPGNVEAWLIKGKSDLALGSQKAAKAALERARNLAPLDDFRVQHEVTAALRKLG